MMSGAIKMGQGVFLCPLFYEKASLGLTQSVYQSLSLCQTCGYFSA